jgi:hypothetical protein
MIKKPLSDIFEMLTQEQQNSFVKDAFKAEMIQLLDKFGIKLESKLFKEFEDLIDKTKFTIHD